MFYFNIRENVQCWHRHFIIPVFLSMVNTCTGFLTFRFINTSRCDILMRFLVNRLNSLTTWLKPPFSRYHCYGYNTYIVCTLFNNILWLIYVWNLVKKLTLMISNLNKDWKIVPSQQRIKFTFHTTFLQNIQKQNSTKAFRTQIDF